VVPNGVSLRWWRPPTHHHPSTQQVINTAFQLLTSSSVTATAVPAAAAAGGGGAAPSSPAPSGLTDPLGAVVALTRALWEYMHVHALCRKLAKPFKVACALRNVLLVADVPLYARWAGGWVLGCVGGKAGRVGGDNPALRLLPPLDCSPHCNKIPTIHALSGGL